MINHNITKSPQHQPTNTAFPVFATDILQIKSQLF